MKKIIWIATLTVFACSISILFDSCNKENTGNCPTPTHSPTESTCKINGIDTVFNYCARISVLSCGEFWNLKNVDGERGGDNINFSMVLLCFGDDSNTLQPPILNRTYTLEDFSGVRITYQNTLFVVSKKKGSFIEFTVNAIGVFCELGYSYGDQYSISGNYSVLAIEDTNINPDTIRITNGVFEGLNSY